MAAEFRTIGKGSSSDHLVRRAACYEAVDHKLRLILWETSAPPDQDQLMNGDYVENVCETFDKHEMKNFIRILAESYEAQWGEPWDR